jgi:hypothetical protein
MAAGVLGLAALAAVWLLWDYARHHASLAANPASPSMAAALVLGVAAVMALAILAFRPERDRPRDLIATSVVWSLALLLALIGAWRAATVSERQTGWNGVPVFSEVDAAAYLAEQVPAGLTPIRIPTGVLIQSLEFLSGDNVQVSGHIWQRYGPTVPADLVRGVALPEAVNEAYTAGEVYRFERDGIETVGWYFAVTLREPFAYAEFPFDQQNLRLRLWSRDFTQDVVLIPDFAAYRSLAPTSLPGLESEFVYSGWTPVFSGFSYAQHRYDASFGIGDADEFANLPELYFNVMLDRNFGGPFVEHGVFAIAVAMLLFGLLLLTTDDEQLKARFQLSTAGVLGAASGLLFAVILKHAQLRSVVASQGISYIEVLPILLYGGIIAVVLNAILLAAPIRVRFVEHRNNLLPALAYWPVLLGLLLAVTLIVLFRG